MSILPDYNEKVEELPDGWTEAPLGEIATLLSGSTPSSSVPAYWGGGVVWITPTDLSMLDSPFITTSERLITEAGRAAASLATVPKGAIVISSRAPIGHIGIAATDLTINQGCKAMVFFKDHDPTFHYYNLRFRMDRIRSRGEGTTFQEISRGELEKVKMPYPTDFEEQRRIAKILHQSDTGLEAMRHEIGKLVRINRGLIQSLLTGHVRVTSDIISQ